MTELVKKHDGAAEVECTEHLSRKFQIWMLCVCVGLCVQWMHRHTPQALRFFSSRTSIFVLLILHGWCK